MQLKLTTELPISVNHMYRIGFVRRGQARIPTQILTQEGRDYKVRVGWEVKAAAIEQGFEPPPKSYFGYVAVAYFPTAGQDLDNVLKVLQDTLFEALGINDNRVIEIRAAKFVARDAPRVELCLTTLSLADVERRYQPLQEAIHVPVLS